MDLQLINQIKKTGGAYELMKLMYRQIEEDVENGNIEPLEALAMGKFMSEIGDKVRKEFAKKAVSSENLDDLTYAKFTKTARYNIEYPNQEEIDSLQESILDLEAEHQDIFQQIELLNDTIKQIQEKSKKAGKMLSIGKKPKLEVVLNPTTGEMITVKPAQITVKSESLSVSLK